MRSIITTISAVGALASIASGSVHATSVLSYDQGSNAAAGYTDALTALGGPESFTGEGSFPTGVTPFNPAFGTDELVSIGSGGHLTLELGSAITNSAAHAFGVDLILFSNAGFADASWTDSDPNNDGTGLTGSSPFIFGAGGAATIQISTNAVDWVTVTTTTLDLFPTLGALDYDVPTPFAPGSVAPDFTQAMDPSLTLADFADLTYTELLALYGTSGGGIGIDIASTGLESASYLRFVNNSGSAFEIDAVSVVPAPGALSVILGAGLVGTRRRRD